MPLHGGLCVPGAPGPSGGAEEPQTKAAGGSVGQVTGSFLQPTPEPPRGVARTCGLWCSLTDPEGHRRHYTECWTSWGCPGGWKVRKRAALPQERSRERSPPQTKGTEGYTARRPWGLGGGEGGSGGTPTCIPRKDHRLALVILRHKLWGRKLLSKLSIGPQSASPALCSNCKNQSPLVL